MLRILEVDNAFCKEGVGGTGKEREERKERGKESERRRAREEEGERGRKSEREKVETE